MLTHLIQAPRSSLLFHFTDEESKAQREPMVWQSQEPTLPLNCQAPQPRSPCRVCKRQKGKPQPKKTVGSCQDELWSHEQVGMVQATLPERPKDLLQAAKKVPCCAHRALAAAPAQVGASQAVSDTDLCKQRRSTACRSSGQSRVARPQKQDFTGRRNPFQT